MLRGVHVWASAGMAPRVRVRALMPGGLAAMMTVLVMVLVLVLVVRVGRWMRRVRMR
jgi:uncharacterized membrane protein